MPSVLVEAGSKGDLGRALCSIERDEREERVDRIDRVDRIELVEGQLAIPRAALGSRFVVRVGDCAAPEPLLVVVVGGLQRWDGTARLFVDQARMEVRGNGASNVNIWWRSAPDETWSATDCGNDKRDGLPGCIVTIPSEAARTALTRSWELARLPAGTPPPAGSGLPEVWLRGAGDRATRVSNSIRLPPPELVVDGPLLHETSVEAWREQVVLPLTVPPAAVVSISCRSASCWLSDDHGSVVLVPPATGQPVAINARLRADVCLGAGGDPGASVTVSLPIVRCQLHPASSFVLGGTNDHLVPVMLGERCPANADDLMAETVPPSAPYIESSSPENKSLDIRLGHVPRGVESLELRLVRASTRAVVGSTRLAVRSEYVPKRIRLVDDKLGDLAVVPTNREVRLQWASPDAKVGADLVPLSLPGYFTIRREDNATWIRGEAPSLGGIPIPFAYEPEGRDRRPLVTFDSTTHFAVQQVNAAVSLDVDNARTGKLFSVHCRNSSLTEEREIRPGEVVSLPYAARGTCHLRIDPTVLDPRDGAQRIHVAVSITSPTGATRAGGIARTISLAAGGETDALWLGDNDVMRPFDHLTVQLYHDAEAGHYAVDGGASGLPARRYQIVFGDTRLRLYGSATVPTGLYRVTRGPGGGILQFSAGVLARLAVLDREGREFPLALEMGLLGTDLSGSAALSVVMGPGITVPLLNSQESAQAAIGLHAWLEYSPSRVHGQQHPFAFVFGPSISLGDFGTNL